MKVFNELKQRKVLQTAALYFAIAWGATEILSFLIERIPVFPAWTDTAIAILFVLGFPAAMFLAWMFDVGKDGVRRADPASGMGKGVIALSVAGLLVATGALSYLLLPKIEAERGFVAKGDFGTVAVLPFENLTGDPSLGYLGVGLAEDIRQRLSSYTDLRVIGRVSIAGFAGAGIDLASVRGLLDAGLVLEGSLQNAAGQMQVSIALLDTATGRQIWSNIFSADKTGWGPLRQRIVQSLAEQLALTVRVREVAAPIPDEALDAYLRALSELGQPEVADGWFDEAIRQAPEFSDAWARKALLRMDMIWRGMPDAQGWEEAEPLFTRAREIEPDNLLADIAEAQLQWLAKLDPIASHQVLQRTLARAPNHPLVLAGMATASRYLPGGLEDAEKYSRRYLAQDPLNPDAHNVLATALTFNHRYDEAWPHYERAIELDPGYMLVYEYKANQEYFRNSPAEALVTMTRKAQVEVTARDETERCLLYMAAGLLPVERAEPLLRDAIQRGVDKSLYHAWCSHPLETLVGVLVYAGRDEDAATVMRQLKSWVDAGGAINGLERIYLYQEAPDHCEDKLCRISESLGEEAMAAWLGPDPPLHAFSQFTALNIADALIETGRVEEGRQFAARAGAAYMELAGPEGHPTVSGPAVRLLALAGDFEAALDYAEQVGPEGFAMFGRELGSIDSALSIPGLTESPRWAVFTERCRARWLEEIEKFDRLVASGEIVMP
jgi:TolB-like protein